ncbi:conserved unknown protein [Ectocarpus siliculosus]|uniref:DUF155 domain-containing protein n=1 Tax=Ectocarpus siliculosus TaxID=2880 RepID=D7G0L7_ECTSI|nr:conserved unknown protein [Ectocarpus siliculosus]|eukprot:CBJ33046.1 conserved unknown protein [Ectocarpus siliculosus]
MFPRAISRRLPAVGVRPLSTRKAHDCWGSAWPSRQSSTITSVSDGTRSSSSIRPQHGSGRGPETASAAALSPVRRWRQGRQFSRGGRAGAPVTSSELAQADGEEEEEHGGGRDSSLSVSSLGIEIGNDDGSSSCASPTPPEAAGLRPETAPASTPLDLGCKAYYMATNIGIKAVCTRLYAGFPRSFEKHCVVIGPLDPNCFEGGYPSPRDPSEGFNGVFRDLSRLKSKKSLNAAAAAAAAAATGRAGRSPGGRGGHPDRDDDEEELGRRPFVPPPRPFAMDGPAYQARAWDMWEPGGGEGGTGAGLRVLGVGMGGRRVGKEAGNSYVVLFDYGSVVFIHFTKEQQEAHLSRQREFLYEESKIPPGDVKTDSHGVVLWSTLPEPARLEPDRTTLRELDVNHITIIGTVLGQTVALDHYGDLVDSMMSKFVAINSGVEKTGKFTAAQKKELFQLVARNNTVRTDVISKLGILERQEAAWKDPDYNYVWEGLREEFEMDSRLRKIESKLSMLQQNTNFFIEMLHNQKSTMLEWTIIVLIAAEIVVGVCDLLNVKPFP